MILEEFIEELSIYGLVNSSDVCGALKVINAGRRLIYPLDDWTGTIEYGCVNLCDQCFVLPYGMLSIRDVWNCNEVTLGDEVWSSIAIGTLNQCCGTKAGVTKTDRFVPIPKQPKLGSLIGAKALDSNDEGKTVSITIRNAMGSIETQKITLKFRETVYADMIAGRIESLSKESTVGRVSIYEKETCGNECKLHTLEPEERSGMYYIYKTNCTSGCAIIKAKKKCLPYTVEDLGRELDIQGTNGLITAIQAIGFQRNGDNAKFAETLKIARSLLERQKEDLKKTSEGAKSQVSNVSHPISTATYGYY